MSANKGLCSKRRKV